MTTDTMTRTPDTVRLERIPVFVRWIPFALILLACFFLGRQEDPLPKTLAIYGGLVTPLLNMCHLMFLMLTATVAYCVVRKPVDFGLLLFGTAVGILLQAVYDYIPGAKLVSGLSLLFLLLLLWFPGKLGRISGPVIFLCAVAQGIWIAADGMVIAGGVLHSLVASCVLITCVALGYAWGSSMRTLRQKSESAYEGIEHLLVATVAGTALVYIYWGLFKDI